MYIAIFLLTVAFVAIALVVYREVRAAPKDGAVSPPSQPAQSAHAGAKPNIDLPAGFRFDISAVPPTPGGARNPKIAALAGSAAPAAVGAPARTPGASPEGPRAGTPARRTEDLDFTDVREFLAAGLGSFTTSGLQPCDCKVRNAFTGWGRCQRRGGASFVFHGTAPDGTQTSAKVYIPAARRGMMSPDDLEAVDERLRALPPAAASQFVRSRFLRDEFELRSDAAGERTHHRLDAALMPRLGGDRVRLLDKFASDFRDSPAQLARAAEALRTVWIECARHGLAHGDLCAWNIVIEEPAAADGRLRAILLDTDSLSWKGHTTVVTRLRGQPGFYTRGRSEDPAHFAKHCGDDVHMIDLPSQLIIYLSILAYACTPRGHPDLPVPDETLGFDKDDAMESARFKARIKTLRAVLRSGARENAAVRRLLSDLLAHCSSPDGVDAARPSPFVDPVIAAGLASYEARLRQDRAKAGAA